MATLTSLNAYGFAWNGFAFGGAKSPYQITSADGIEGLPVIRNQDDNQGFNDGMFSGRDFFGGRWYPPSLKATKLHYGDECMIRTDNHWS